MAIRKDIDDMLNNLKDGKPLEQPSNDIQPQSEPVQQTGYENMSVDDLLTSLIGDTSSETAAEEVPAEPIVKPKKKRIVISHELPDYEAIREASLKEDAQRAEAEKQAERERLRAEREAEIARIEAERKAAEEAELARIEAERKAAEEAELARIESERKAAEEAELARIEAERKAAEEAELARIEAERKAAEEAELARIEAERKATEEAELARIEAERQAIDKVEPVSPPIDATEIPHSDNEKIMADAIAAVSTTTDDDESEELSEDKKKLNFFKNWKKPEKPENSADDKSESAGITSVLHNILDEDPDEIMNQQKYFAEYSAESKKGRFKKVFYAVFGVIFALLACVGLVTVIAKSISLIGSYTSGETKKEGFEEVLYPAVIMDIESFNSPAELPPEQIITAAIWSMIMADDVTMQYERTFDVVMIPAADVESYAVKLFGDNLPELTHTTVGPAESRFYYNEETKSYNVPIAPVTYTYSPEIKEATKSGSEYTIKVDYVDELPSWLPKVSSKSVEFTLVESNGSYQLKSMKILSTNTSAV
ncbi:MAG: hypothetical protein J6A57_01255 [Ruminococcus sp.]|nr:hypothetical protein [Ruminococcus sp.]